MVKVKKDLTGQRFGRLTVVYQTDDYVSPNGRHIAQWICNCDCENSGIIVSGDSLKSGKTQSCGCLNRQRIIEFNVSNHKKYNHYIIEDNIVKIKASNADYWFWVDLDIWNTNPYIKEFCWFKDKEGYGRTRIPNEYQKYFNNKDYIFLHNIICPCEKGYEPDHLISVNKWDNRLSNLQIKTHANNMQNKRLPKLAKNNSSGVTGVRYRKEYDKWIWNIRFHNKYYGGTCDTFEEAVQKRKDMEIKLYGEHNIQRRN